MPQIRPIRFTDDLGNPVAGATIYVYEVGKAYTDPNALLTLTDAENGSTISNPFSTDANGFPINATTGARINPFTTAQRWGLYGVNANGVEVYDLPVQVSDTYASGGAADAMVDASFNNFTDLLQEDLAAYSFIFVKSQGSSGWENTTNGPEKSFYAYATGGAIGSPSAGTPDLFYDSQGKEWAMADISDIPYNVNANAISSLKKGHIFGIATSSSDGDTVDITDGNCTDSAGNVIITVSSGSADIKNRIDSGGNLAGAASPSADTTYYLFVVSEADGTNPRFAFDSSLTATNALSEWSTETGETYTLYRLIGFALTDSTPDIIAFQHTGSRWRLKTPTRDYAAASSATRVSASLDSVPSGVSVLPSSFLVAVYNDFGTDVTDYVLVTDLYQDDLTPSSSVYTLLLDQAPAVGQSYPSNAISLESFLTDTSKQIGIRASSTDLLIRITTHGWVYER